MSEVTPNRRLQLLAAVPRELLFNMGIAKEGVLHTTPVMPTEKGSGTLAEVNADLPEWVTRFEDAMVWRTREALEQDTSLVHFIPYLIVHDDNGEVFHYQRTKQIGEQKLAGNRSIGLGGHMDVTQNIVAWIYQPNYNITINPFLSAINAGLSAELHEELDAGDEYPLQNIIEQPVLQCLLYDDRGEMDAVGKVHLGLVFTVKLRADSPVKLSDLKCKEAELITLPPLRLPVEGEDAPQAFEGALEGWSEYLAVVVRDMLA